jgi:hypothetical protein
LNPFFDKFIGVEFIGFRLYTTIEYALITLFFYKTLDYKPFLNSISISVFGFILIVVADFIFRTKETFDSIPAGASALLILLYSTLYLFEKIKDTHQIIYHDESFWIICGLIIYFSGTFFIFIGYKYYNSKEYTELYSLINYFFSVTRNVFILTGIAMVGRKNNHLFE